MLFDLKLLEVLDIPEQPIKLIIKLYPDQNKLWFKYATHQKAESLIAGSLSKLYYTVNSGQQQL